MRLARDADGHPLEPSKGARAFCNVCGTEVMAKCGDINIWHWAHTSLEDCDPWSEPMTQWHLRWQEHFPLHLREVALPPHRADALTHTGGVVEFQHSYISPAEVQERERFYGKMIWIFDLTDDQSIKKFDILPEPHNGVFFYHWKQPKRHILRCAKPVYLDVGDKVLKIVEQLPACLKHEDGRTYVDLHRTNDNYSYNFEGIDHRSSYVTCREFEKEDLIKSLISLDIDTSPRTPSVTIDSSRPFVEPVFLNHRIFYKGLPMNSR